VEVDDNRVALVSLEYGPRERSIGYDGARVKSVSLDYAVGSFTHSRSKPSGDSLALHFR
jgi:hypothetical protein